MESITVNALTFRWMYDGLVVTADDTQRTLSASEAYQLLRYLYNQRESIYEAEPNVTIIAPLYELQAHLHEVKSEYGYE